MFGSGCHGLIGDLGIVARLGFGGRDIADRLEEAPMVEPVHPFESRELHCLGMTPRAAPMLRRFSSAALSGASEESVKLYASG